MDPCSGVPAVKEETPAIREMRQLAASPLMIAALFCMTGGLLYLFFAEGLAVLRYQGVLPLHDPLLTLHAVRDAMLLLEVLLLQMLLGGLWAICLAARGNGVWRPVRSLGWIHGVLLAEFVYEMLVLALELAANLMDTAIQPEKAGEYWSSVLWLVGFAVLTTVLHHRVIGALNAGREALRTGVPCTRHLSVVTAVMLFAASAVAMLEPAAWLTVAGEVLLTVLLLQHRRNMKQLACPTE